MVITWVRKSRYTSSNYAIWEKLHKIIAYPNCVGEKGIIRILNEYDHYCKFNIILLSDTYYTKNNVLEGGEGGLFTSLYINILHVNCTTCLTLLKFLNVYTQITWMLIFFAHLRIW